MRLINTYMFNIENKYKTSVAIRLWFEFKFRNKMRLLTIAKTAPKVHDGELMCKTCHNVMHQTVGFPNRRTKKLKRDYRALLRC